MDPSGSRREASLLLAFLPLFLFAAFAVCQGVQAFTQAIGEDGPWISTKTTLSRPVPGTMAFMHDRQSLAHGRLNLHSWFGFHELFHEPLESPLESLQWDFALGNHGYLVTYFHRTDATDLAIRLSRYESYPSALLEIDRQGRFVKNTPIPGLDLQPGVVHSAALSFRPDEIEFMLDGGVTVSIPRAGVRSNVFGFRSGADFSAVDSVTYLTTDGTLRIRGFSKTGRYWNTIVLALLATLLLVTVAYRVSSRRRAHATPPTGFYFLMAGGLLAIAGGIFWFYAHRQSGQYPELNEERMRTETAFRWGSIDETRAMIDKLTAEPQTTTVMLTGGSQTWGQGASTESSILGEQLCARLRAMRGAPFRCINAAAPGATIELIEPMLREHLERLRPDWLVLNIGSNDMGTDLAEFETQVESVIGMCTNSGVSLILVHEPHSPELVPANLLKKHELLTRLAETHGVPLLHLHRALASEADSGFLWWDMVHLTSYGQGRAAHHIATTIVASENRD